MMILSGCIVDRELEKKAKNHDINILNMYGSTELGGITDRDIQEVETVGDIQRAIEAKQKNNK